MMTLKEDKEAIDKYEEFIFQEELEIFTLENEIVYESFENQIVLEYLNIMNELKAKKLYDLMIQEEIEMLNFKKNILYTI